MHYKLSADNIQLTRDTEMPDGTVRTENVATFYELEAAIDALEALRAGATLESLGHA